MFELSANLELLFSDPVGVRTVADRVRQASALGLPAVEIWTWRDKNLDELAAVLAETGVVLQTMCVEPMGVLVDPATHGTFLSAVADSLAVAEKLACPYLVITAGDDRPGVPRAIQHRAIVDALRAAARILAGHDVTLLLENLNSKVDHVGTFLDSTAECLDIIDEISSPSIGLLYDHYHSLMMGERPEVVLAGRVELVRHMQIADVPGRHEPGTGGVDWPCELATLRQLGYSGRIGLEYVPTVQSVVSLREIRKLVELGG